MLRANAALEKKVEQRLKEVKCVCVCDLKAVCITSCLLPPILKRKSTLCNNYCGRQWSSERSSPSSFSSLSSLVSWGFRAWWAEYGGVSLHNAAEGQQTGQSHALQIGREGGVEGRSLLKAAIPVFGCGRWLLLSAQSRLFAGGFFPSLPCVKSTGGPCDGGLSSDGKRRSL